MYTYMTIVAVVIAFAAYWTGIYTCMYVYVCECVSLCKYTYMYICTYIYMHIWIYISIIMWLLWSHSQHIGQVYTYDNIRLHMYTWICLYMYLNVRKFTCITIVAVVIAFAAYLTGINIFIYVYMNMYMYLNVNKFTCIHVWQLWLLWSHLLHIWQV
jgi:hypothetical protein